MGLARTATASDLPAFRALWTQCFPDPPEFIDWFFRQRYLPEYSACVEEEGQIVSTMQSLPLSVRLRGKLLPGAIVAGVSTDPAHRRKGHKAAMMAYYMQQMRKKGFVVIPYTPAHLTTFYRQEHYPVSNTLHLNLPAGERSFSPPEEISSGTLAELVTLHGTMHLCYEEFSRQYSGIIARKWEDFQVKMADYHSDPATKALLLWDGQERQKLRGYAIYQETENGVHGEEVIASGKDNQEALLTALLSQVGTKACHVKLAPDFSRPWMPEEMDATWEIRPQGVMGVANVERLLAETSANHPPLILELTDPLVPENNGVFTSNGLRSVKTPQICLSVGRLAQLLCGYKSAQELATEGFLSASDASVLREWDQRYPKQSCFIVDEY